MAFLASSTSAPVVPGIAFQAVADATLAYHKERPLEYISVSDKLKSAATRRSLEADLTTRCAAGYNKPFKTVAEGVTEYMAWLNRDA